MKDNENIKIILDLNGCVCGLTIKNENDETIEFKDLSFRMKVKVVNCFKQFYDCLIRSFNGKKE